MIKSRLTVATLIAGAGAVGAILAAPMASAEETPSCTQAGNVVAGTSTVCQSPGNAQLTASPGMLGESQFGMWPWGGAYGYGIGVL